MNWLNLGAELVLVLGALSAVLLAFRKIIAANKAGRVDQKTELEAAIKINAVMRDELRKDNEGLRIRVAILEGQIDTLDKEVAAIKIENLALEAARDDLTAEVRILKLALNKSGNSLKLDKEG